MTRLITAIAPLCLTLAANLCLAAPPEIVSLAKIWDKGEHNAFTDLIRWHDKWYCSFRESEAHVGGDGQIRILVSDDGQKWESAALIGETGIDLRDPKLSITPDDRLMVVAGGSVYGGTKVLKTRQPRVCFSNNGREWTPPQRVLEDGDWLWRVTWHGGKAYGICYDAGERTSAASKSAAETGKVNPGPADWKLRLVSSSDGVKYDLITHLDVPGAPNETTIRFLPGVGIKDSEMIALVRREEGNRNGWIGRSKAPYKEWTWKETEHRFGGPNFIRLPDGSLWAAGRSYPGGAKTVLAKMTAAGGYEPVLTFPSGGDTSYPGLIWHDGLLWMSYYSSHEGKTSIYLAKIKLPLDAEKIGKRTQPMVDDYLIDRIVGSAKLAAQNPTPREVVLTADKPWEGNTSAYYTVFRDGDKFRMYYRGHHFDEKTKKPAHREVTCYAESNDGVHFTKPDLGLFEYEGSTQNNIVWNGPGCHNFTPFLDENPAADPNSRYKAVTFIKGGLLALGSPDGIHWKQLAEKPVITKGIFDSQNLVFWDTNIKKYREYHRALRGGVRDIMTATSDNFLNWPEPQFLDYPDSAPEHLYTNTVSPYPGIPEILVGFPTRFLPKTEQTEPIFMVSRDGLTFERYRDAVIPPTATANRDGNRSNYMAWGLVQIPSDKDWSVYAKEAYYAGAGSRLRRFTYRPDGLAAVTADEKGGEVITRPVQFTGSKLMLNYRAAPKGSIRVELQDADGQPIGQFTAADSQRLTSDSRDVIATWASGTDLASLANKSVRLRFVLNNAELFAFRFE
jgi:hypothetical protein